MNISTKGKYAIASMLYMATKKNEKTSVSLNTIADNLNISKIYLEQIFSLLKKADLVISIKGPNGGYQLKHKIKDITLLKVLQATETNLENKKIIQDDNLATELNLTNYILDTIDTLFINSLKSITLENLLDEMHRYNENGSFMYYI